MTTEEAIQDSLSIKELIRRVHQELIESQIERELLGQESLFEVEKLILEVNFVITRSEEGKGGMDIKILTLGAGTLYQHQQVHKVTLTLKAKTEEPEVNSHLSVPSSESGGSRKATGRTPAKKLGSKKSLKGRMMGGFRR